MKLFRLILMVSMVLFSVNLVSAQLTTNNEFYWTLDNVLTDATGNGNTLDNNGATNIPNGKINSAFSWDGIDDFMNLSFDYNQLSFSVSGWFNITDDGGAQFLFSLETDSQDKHALSITNTDLLQSQIRISGSPIRDDASYVGLYDTYRFLTWTYNVTGGDTRVYVDGVLLFNYTSGTTPDDTTQIGLGALVRSSPAIFTTGLIDEVSMWSRVLSVVEIVQLNNSGLGCQFDYAACTPIPVVTINSPANGSFFNTTSIPLNVSTNINTNLSYIFNGAAEVALCINCNSSTNITLIGVEGLNNLTVFSNFTGTITNDTSQFTIDLTNPFLQVNLPAEFNFYLGFNFSSFINVSDINLDTCVVTVSNEPSTTCTQENYNFTFNGNHSINVTATDLAGRTNSSLNNIMLINPNQCHNFFDLGAPITNYTFGSTSFSSNPACFKTFNDGLGIGNNTVIFAKLGFATTNVSFVLNSTSELNVSLNITSSRILVSIFDRDTLALLTGLTELTIVPPLGGVGANVSTITGLVNISDINFLSGGYQIIATHFNYSTESIFFTYNNQELLSVDIFMLNLSNPAAGFVIVKAVSDSGPLIQSAICKALEWVPSQSAFVTVAQGLTDTNGETILNIEVGTKLYKFTCEKAGQLVISPQQIIQASGVTVPLTFVTIEAAPEISLVEFNGSLTNVTLNATHQQIIYDFNDPLGTVSEACIKVFKTTGLQRILQSNTCSSSSTGQIQIVLNVNNTFTLDVEATAEVTGTVTVVDTLTFGKIGNIEDALKALGLHIIVPMLFLCLGLALGLMTEPNSLLLSGIGGIVGVIISFLILPSVISFSIALFVSIILVIMITGSQKRK